MIAHIKVKNRFSPGKHIPIRPFKKDDNVDVYVVLLMNILIQLKKDK